MRLFILPFLCLTISCSQTIKTIEVKNDAGKIIEIYQIDEDSLKIGEAKIFDDEGRLFDLSNYIKGELNGERIIYYKDGSVDTKENYVNNVLVGKYTQYHENGNLMQSGIYNQGVLSGEVISYFENGSLKESVTFLNNQEHGPFAEYYENGKKHWEGTYRNGDNEFGLLIEYDSLEQVIKKMDCDTLGMCRTIWTIEKGDITPSF